MKNDFLRKFDSIVKVKITGKNINRYLKRIIKRKVDIIKLIPINYREIDIIISYKDYLELKKIKSIYDISVIETYGKLKIKEKIKGNYFLILFLVLGLALIVFLSRMIFSIEVIHSNKDIIELVEKELNKNNIKRFTLKKKNSELEKIENKILSDNKDKLDWIEIIESGTKYTVRVEERIIIKGDNQSNYQDIVASKNAVITKIKAISGEKVVDINTFVRQGSIIVSGSIVLPSGDVILTHASGEIFGEVWYTVNIEFPYAYYEEKRTGKSKNKLVLKFLGKRYSYFDYKNYQSKDKTLLKSILLPIELNYEKSYETNITEKIYTDEEAKEKTILLAKDKLLKSNDKIESIRDVKVLSEDNGGDTIKLKLFISVIENITEFRNIEKSND